VSGAAQPTSGGFSAEVERLVAAVRALLAGHWTLLKAELGAIARDAVITLIGAIVIVALLIAALLGLFIALFLILGAAAFGSMLWGAAQMTLLLLVLAAAIASSLLRITARRRRRSWLLAFVGGAAGALVVLLLLHGDAAPAAGLSITLALSLLLIDLLIGLRDFELQRFTDRFVPLVSEAELRATVSALDALREEALAGVAAEVGAAAASADSTLGALRGAVSRVADAVKGLADRLRPEREDA